MTCHVALHLVSCNTLLVATQWLVVRQLMWVETNRHAILNSKLSVVNIIEGTFDN